MKKYNKNRCENLNICILGDLSKYLKCRKENCPDKTIADVKSPFILNKNKQGE